MFVGERLVQSITLGFLKGQRHWQSEKSHAWAGKGWIRLVDL